MVWYNPTTWFKKEEPKPEPQKSSVIFTPSGPMTISPDPKVSNPFTGKGGGGGGSSYYESKMTTKETPTPSAETLSEEDKKTLGTGTGYDPATKTNMGNLPTAQSYVTVYKTDPYLKETYKSRQDGVKQYLKGDYWKGIVGTTFGAGEYNLGGGIFGATRQLFRPLDVYEQSRGEVYELPSGDTKIVGGKLSEWYARKFYPDYAKGRTSEEILIEKAKVNPDLIKPTGFIATDVMKGVETELYPEYEKRARGGESIVKLQKEYEIEATKLYEERFGNAVGSSIEFKKEFFEATKPREYISTGLSSTALVGSSIVAPISSGAIFFAGGQYSGWENLSNIGQQSTLGGKIKSGTLAGLNFGISYAGAYSSLKNIGGQITVGQMEDVLAQKPKITTGYRIQQDKLITDVYGSIQQTPYAKATSLGYSKSTLVGKSTFVSKGKIATEVITEDFWTGRPILSISKQSFGTIGKGFPTLQAQGYTPSISITGTNLDYQASIVIGKKGIKGIGEIGGSTKYDFSTAITKQEGGFVKSLGGKDFTAKYIKTPSGSAGGIKFDVQDVGLLKKINMPKVDFTPTKASGGSTFTGITPKTTTIVKPITSFPTTKTISTPKINTISSTVTAPFISTKLDNIVKPVQKGFQIPATKSIQNVQLKQKDLTKDVNVPVNFSLVSPATSLKMRQAVSQIPALKQITTQKTTQITPTIPTTNTGVPNFSTPIDFGGGWIPPMFPSFDFGFGRTKRMYRGKQRKKYTPSFDALVFGIKGKQPKGIETGLRTRPIPKGFSWAFGVKDLFGKKKKKKRKKK